ncbi:MAG TPA: hypothetical protein VE777_14615 [Gaiellales bacterium]|jgi:hypothetical protein|nr:hypothetical protein [Gaiellales bacterium]
MPVKRPRLSARGILFAVLAAGLLGIAYEAVTADQWVVAAAAAVIGLWMGDLALRDAGLRRRA